ncbi:MAG: pirin family protein [Pseudomonadales bacterium]
MSYQNAIEPECIRKTGRIELLIRPKSKDLGEFSVRRVLPASERRMVGPFIFFDHMGPAEFTPGKGIQVRPHPHIGIATITYLFEGEILHRDSLGYAQPIRPGAVNLMTAGRGIVHSERAGSDLDTHSRLHGIQSWLALPDGQEEIEPAFEHVPAASLPGIEMDGAELRVIMGSAFGETSPVTTYSPTLYLEVKLKAGTQLEIPAEVEEPAAYVVSGELTCGSTRLDEGVMGVACRGERLLLDATADSRVMVVGGAAVGERHIWWNLVSSSKARIEQAKADWREGRFDEVPGDSEFIPLPDR